MRLFPTNLGIFEIENSQTINEQLRAIPELADNSHRLYVRENIWSIKDDHTVLQQLHDIVLEKVAEYAEKCYPFKYRPEHFSHVEGWAENVAPGAQNFFMHSHRTTHVACVYYYNVNETSGAIDFVDPRANLGILSLSYNTSHNIYRHTPRNGQLIMFPGWLLHYIHPNKSNTVRQVISTNIKIKEEYQFTGIGSSVLPDITPLNLD